MYLIKLKAGHPTGIFRRGGLQVETNLPVVVDAVPPKVRLEPWFEISEITPAQLEKLKNKFSDLRAKKEEKEMTQPVHPATALKPKKDK